MINTNTLAPRLRIRSLNCMSGKSILIATADSATELSRAVPISATTGIDSALRHALIHNPVHWEVIVEAYNQSTDEWVIIRDNRIFIEDIDEI